MMKSMKMSRKRRGSQLRRIGPKDQEFMEPVDSREPCNKIMGVGLIIVH
jgi:hypothetical protein